MKSESYFVPDVFIMFVCGAQLYFMDLEWTFYCLCLKHSDINSSFAITEGQ